MHDMKNYNRAKFTLMALATLLCGNIWAQVSADFTSNITTACAVPATISFTSLATSPGVGIETWAWDFGNGLTSTVANPSVSYSIPGNFTVSLIVTDSLGASDTLTQTAYIDLSSALYITHTNVNTSCNGCADGSITLNVSGGTPLYTYFWSNSSTTASITGVEAGDYTVTVTDDNGCSTAQTIYLDSLCAHYISSTISPSCTGGSNGAIDVVLQNGAAPPYIYTWSNGATTQDLTGLTAGFYSLTITDGGSCSELYYFIVPSSSGIQVSIDVDQPISCNGATDGMLGSTVTGGVGGFSYYWKDPNYCYVCPPSPPGPSQPDTFPNAWAGMYILSVYDANGCGGIDTLVLTEPSPITVSAVVLNNSCTACNDGGITATATGGNGGFQYSIDGGNTYQASNTFTGLPRGTYTIDVMDFNGCIGSASGIVVDTACLHSTTLQSLVNADCYGGATGSISVVTTGSISPYNYVWSNGVAGSSTVNNMPAGTYYLETTDAIGCVTQDTFMITEPPQIIANVIVNDAYCFGENQGGAQVIVTGGVLPVMYSWTGRPAFTGFDTIQDLAAGSYFVTVTDMNACEVIAPFTINQPTALTVTTTTVDASCPGCTDGSITANVTGGVLPYTYVWASSPPQTTQTATSLPVGTYSLTVADANGCTATASATVGFAPCNLTVDLGNDTAVCFGVHSINAIVGNAQGTILYNWNTGAVTQVINASSAYNYAVFVTDITTGCTATDTIIVSDANPAATVSNDTTICLGGTASLLATGGTSYDWTGGLVSNNNIANPTTSPTQTSLYFVEIDNGTCVSVRYVLITVDSSCTWPGDADNSGLVDNDDVLAIGIGYGDTGPTRSFASLVWEGQRSSNWTNSLLSGTNYKHIDTDGNGTIDDDDTLAISLNYGLSHPKREDERETTMPMIFVELPDSVSAGQTVQGALILGTDSFPLSNLYGIKFTMNYNTDFIEENTVSFSFGPSWMGTPGSDMLTFQKDLYANGRIDGAITGINHINRGGFGNIGIVNFTMKDDISGKDLLALPMVFDFVNIRAIDANEGLVDVEGGATTVIATQEVTGIGSVKANLPVAVYPNPAQNVLYVNTYGEQLESIQVSNMLGATFVLPMTHNAGIYAINTESISAGVYILTIQSQNHVAIERIVINK